MCVIIHRPANIALEEQVLKNCYDNNPDGWGLMFPIDGRLMATKDVTDFNSFMTAYNDVPADTPLGIHFRIKTHGKTDKANCHPFEVLNRDLGDEQDISLMHNGIIQTDITDDKYSDTWHFVNHVLRPVLGGKVAPLNVKGFNKMLGDTIGHSKLLLLADNGAELIINEKLGTRLFNCWFSNSFSHYARTKSYNYGWVGSANKGAAALKEEFDDYGDYYGGVYDAGGRNAAGYSYAGGKETYTPAGTNQVCAAQPAEDKKPSSMASITVPATNVVTARDGTKERFDPKIVKKTAKQAEVTLYGNGDIKTEDWEKLEECIRGMSGSELEEYIIENTDHAALILKLCMT